MKTRPIFLSGYCALLAIAGCSSEITARHSRLVNRALPELLLPRTGKVKRASCSPQRVADPGVINIVSACGNDGATKSVTKVSGPNGNIDFLNCGVNTKGGWTPPSITKSNVIAISLSDAMKDSNSAFKPCSPFISLFEKYADQYDLFPIQLASIAMQESGCNPATVGGAGEEGLFQLTSDKCHKAPHGNCKDPDYNIRTGAALFKSFLDDNDGNILLAHSRYNGWFPHMTVKDATAAADTDCCRCQNNLDYLHQTVNGWYQGINAYNADLGKYFNLAKCFPD